MKGLLKLDKLENVSYNTFKVNATEGILDLRGRYGLEQNPLKGYNIDGKQENTIIQGDEVNGIYFTKKGIKEVENLEDVENLENEENLKKIFKTLTLRIKKYDDFISRKIYVDEDKKNNIATSIYPISNYENLAGKRTPRSLEEFEYYGNNGRFEKSAYDSYEGNFQGIELEEIDKLLEDKNRVDGPQLALNNNTAVYA